MLGHDIVRAEQFPALTATPQQACFAGARDSDMVLLLVGERYGPRQSSGLSATHEENREARQGKPILVFVESVSSREPAQQEFLDEVEAWATGHFRAAFTTPDELKAAVLRALHDYELATAAGPVDEENMLSRARALLPDQTGVGGTAQLVIAIASGPHQQVLRPTELEDAALARDIQREGLFGEHPVLKPSEGTAVTIRDDSLVVEQQSASVLVDQVGSIRITRPARRDSDDRAGPFPALIEEDMTEALVDGLRFAGWLLDRVDPVRRVTDVVVVSSLAGGGYMPWRTRAEQATNPRSAQVGTGGDDAIVTLTPPRRNRQALTHDADRLAEDLLVLLRRARS